MSMRRTIGLLAALATAGCHPHTPQARPAVQPETELARALSLFRHGDARRALVVLQRLTFEFGPGQPELVTARYYLAESYFQMGDRVQAAHEFRKIADEFPASEYASLALLRAGDANLRLWRRPEVDPTPGETALAIYQEVAERYPDTDAAARAALHVRRLQNLFAEKTYKNGLFYFRRKAYDSAILYFKDVIANYPDAARTPDALLRLVDSYRVIRYTEELKETCAHLRQYYPRAAGLAKTCPADASGAPS
jgi:outer membrane protein assembly factor BamD